ncbi:DUF6090 family protein [Winogradskyella sp. SYSU M77433]|uniref:DUF6090 family protein n=1 Tax=Winogradskyella sp. SYSU M77433 TaxID=3042722 RepID=UPI002480D847|nr:DUF6090 family protein [Winogradskyella sp. SYSU M77433]MDH7914447.1 DUF6090 family protein [Winogradskyella sp. SYSU M77433]
MLKFFRNIRKSLLNEGKTGKYLKYAIGEIVLVVIGILIALQINNWNENRKLENSKEKLMLALKKELLINQETLERYTLELYDSNSKFNKVLNVSAGKITLPPDSLKQYLSEAMYATTLSFLNTVQEEAVSTGKFELLSDTLKQKLSLLKDYTKSRTSIYEERSKNYYNSDLKLEKLKIKLGMNPDVPERISSHPPIPTHPEFLLNESELLEVIKDPETYIALGNIYKNYMNDEIWIKFGLLRLTKESVALIDKELSEL